MYKSDTIVTVLRCLNDTYFLPAIQREFVWKPEHMIRLFDSVMQDYPIGSFLFWELDQANRDKWEAYYFLTEFKEGGTHNRQADLIGVRNPVLALDGQQRLTTLLIGLRGKRTHKLNTDRPDDDPFAWVDHHLYLDLLSDPAGNPDPKTGYRSRFEFKKTAGLARYAPGRYWFRVGRILDCVTDNERYQQKTDEKATAGRLAGKLLPQQQELIDRNLDLLYQRIWRDETLAFHLERLQDYDRVLEIFVRANDGGAKLTKSDLLLSMVTANWDQRNAREEIYRLVDYINKGLAPRNRIDKDFVLKCALVLCDLPVSISAQNFTTANMRLIGNHWDRIKQAIELSFILVKSFGLEGAYLTSNNAVIPIIYYLMQQPGLTVGGSSVFDVANTKAIHTWLAVALLTRLFGAQGDNVLVKARTIIKDEATRSHDFPLSAIVTKVGLPPDRLSTVIVNQVQKLRYPKPLMFLALTLLYKETDWTNRSQDHIFPISLFTEANLTAAGIPLGEHNRYITLANSIGNLELLVSADNKAKSNMQFDEWMRDRHDDFGQRHFIPEDATLYSLQSFLAFVREREKLIMDHLRQLFGAA